MMISTRGRYALRVLTDLAEHGEGYIPMKDVAARQGISKKYMEQIMSVLVQNGFVEGVHGKGGGYRLSRPPEECIVGEILQLTEGSLAPVACLACGACARMCPQKIDIPAVMRELTETLQTIPKWTDVCHQREAAAKACKQAVR